MTRCIIHIGMHKTGSTSIQRSLEGFEDDRFLYAKLGDNSNHSLPIYTAFSENPERHHLHRIRGWGRDAIRGYVSQVLIELDRSISSARGRTLLISGEDIGVLNEGNLGKFRDSLSRSLDELAVVGYVRPPGAFMASSFQQMVQGGSITSFDPKQIYRNYQSSFARFDSVFGRDKVQLWKFSPATFPGGCVVRDFCARLGIDLPEKRIVRLNESLSRNAVCVLYTYRKLGEELGAQRLAAPEAMKLGRLVGGADKFRLSPDVVRPVLEAKRSDLEWIEARLGQSLDEDLGEHQPGDVREEHDLLRPDPKVVATLLDLLGKDAPRGVKSETPQQVALLVHALVKKYIPESRVFRGARVRGNDANQLTNGSISGRTITIYPSDFVERLCEMSPDLLNRISPAAAETFIRDLFDSMREQLDATEEGLVSFAGLGRFRVANVEKKGGGDQRRIVFLPTGLGRSDS